LISALLVASCGGGDEAGEADTGAEEAPATAAEMLSVVMHDIYYGDSNDNIANPPVWTVTSGAEVTVETDNQGALEHNWAVVKPGEEVPQPFLIEEHGDILLFDAGVKPPGETGSATFTAPEAGEYQVICTVAGHYPAMQGTLQVE
jgi:uncharacterized cupredoxin-like copper-binding protein